jgi:hypothetical protein
MRSARVVFGVETSRSSLSFGGQEIEGFLLHQQRDKRKICCSLVVVFFDRMIVDRMICCSLVKFEGKKICCSWVEFEVKNFGGETWDKLGCLL